jgi:hypothetical protein
VWIRIETAFLLAAVIAASPACCAAIACVLTGLLYVLKKTLAGRPASGMKNQS